MCEKVIHLEDQSEPNTILVETNKSSSTPICPSMQYMMSITVKNLFFNIHPLAKTIWNVEDYAKYLYGKRVLDGSRSDIRFDTSSTKVKLCEEKAGDSAEIRSFKRLMKVLLLYTTSNLQHLKEVLQEIALMFGFVFTAHSKGDSIIIF